MNHPPHLRDLLFRILPCKHGTPNTTGLVFGKWSKPPGQSSCSILQALWPHAVRCGSLVTRSVRSKTCWVAVQRDTTSFPVKFVNTFRSRSLDACERERLAGFKLWAVVPPCSSVLARTTTWGGLLFSPHGPLMAGSCQCTFHKKKLIRILQGI